MEERGVIELECGHCDGIGRLCNECGEPANSETNDDMCHLCMCKQQKEESKNG